MKIGIDIGVCRKAECKNFMKIDLGITYGCKFIKCKSELEVGNHRCPLPENCFYKNFHIIKGLEEIICKDCERNK